MSIQLTLLEYETLASLVPPSSISRQQLFERQVAFWTQSKMGVEKDFASLEQQISPSGLFTVVPKKPFKFDLTDFVKLIVWRGGSGQNYLTSVKEEADVSSDAHLLVGLDDGRGMLNVAPKDAVDRIEVEGRLELSLFETVAHVALFPEVLASHAVECGGARREKGDSVPVVCLFHDSFSGAYVPALRASSSLVGDPLFGMASCARRIYVKQDDEGGFLKKLLS